MTMDTPPLIPDSKRPRMTLDDDESSSTASSSELPSPERGSSEDELDEHEYNEAEFLGILALAQQARELYEMSAQPTDLEDCIAYLRDALTVGPKDQITRAEVLHTLAYDLYVLGLNTSASETPLAEDYLSESIELHRQALRLLPANHTARPLCVTRLAIALRARFTHSVRKADLQECIDLHHKALAFRPPGHPDRSQSLMNLANAHWTRFELSGTMDDLERATQLDTEALVLRPPGHANRAAALMGLATDLSTRHSKNNALEDLSQAIELEREACYLDPTDSLAVHGLASLLAMRYQTTHDPADFMAITAICSTRSSSKDHQQGNSAEYSASMLAILAEAYASRFRALGSRQDLVDAVDICRQCLSLGHPEPACSTVARVCLSAYHAHHDPSDLHNAISISQEALKFCVPGHPHRAICLHILAQSLQSSFDTHRRDNDLNDALKAYAAAVQDACCSVRDRLQYTQDWIDLATKTKQAQSLCDACGAAVHLLSLIVHFDDHTDVRAGALARISGILEAVTVLLTCTPTRGMELLEYTQCLAWALALNLQHIPGASAVPPALLQKLRQIFWQLNHSPSPVPLAAGRTCSTPVYDTLENVSAHRQHMASEFDALVEQARSFQGSASFLRPTPYTTLSNGWGNGFVVVLVPAQRECHAFVVFPTSIKPLRILLPLSVARLKDVAERCVAAARDDDDGLYRLVLEEIWQGVVNPIIQKLMLKPTSGVARPRIWWCPIGLFSLLPLHAAGRYSADATANSTSDFLASSYIPTITSLVAHVPWSPDIDRDGGKVFQIVQLMLPRLARLSGTVSVPMEQARRSAPSGALLYLGGLHSVGDDGMSDGAPFFEQTSSHASVLRFTEPARHGRQQYNKLSDISISEAHLEPMTMSYPTIYDAAASTQDNASEFQSLAAVMLAAGYRSAVGTMWHPAPGSKVDIAEALHQELFQNRLPGYTRVPYALDAVVKRLRQSGASFKEWSRYIHIGL